ncbi:MAG TPA: ribokinase [Anaerolineales bacterium]|nr:ribokinase [Anaerolineales bacterium]
MANIIVFGGLLQDITFYVRNWPSQENVVFVKETSDAMITPGGKALNQAIAAARLGGDSSVVGAIGTDLLGDGIVHLLEKEKVSFGFGIRDSNKKTGVVGIILSENNEQHPGYISSPGASLSLTEESIMHAASKMTNNTIVIANYELPQTRVKQILSNAKKHNATTILNPAPIRTLDSNTTYWPLVDYLLPNMDEALAIVGKTHSTKEQLGDEILKLGVGAVCITLGDRGCWFASKNHQSHVPSILIDPTEIVDSVGASDAFCGAFAVGLSERMNINEILKFANCAGALACTKSGGSSSMPYRKDVYERLK